MSRPPEYVGPFFTISCLRLADGSIPAGEFLDSLKASERRKLDVQFEMMGTQGRIENPEKFKKLTGSDEIWEFKSFQIRLLCFFAPGRRLILAYGLRKKRDKYKRKEIKRAEEYRAWFLGQHD